MRGQRLGAGLAAIAAASLTLATSGCAAPAACDAMALSPLVLLKVEGGVERVTAVRACAADLSVADCPVNPLLTDTGTQEPQAEASQVPGTWNLILPARISPIRIVLLDAKQGMLADKTLPLTWESKAVDACHDRDYADVTVSVPTASS